jgi:hypothetical protein
MVHNLECTLREFDFEYVGLTKMTVRGVQFIGQLKGCLASEQ